jgi:hypothetical protein
VIAEKLPSEFRFEHLGSLHLLVVCFIGHGLAALRLVPALVVRQGSSHTVGRELRVSDYVVPAIVELRIAVQDADDFMLDHLQRLFFVG